MAPCLSKFEKWNNLPEEIKCECIKWMDLKSRGRLSRTSHTERRLIRDVVKFRWNELEITEHLLRRQYYLLNMYYDGNRSDWFQNVDDETVFLMVAFILKTVRLDTFRCSQKDSDVLKLLSRLDESSIHHISSYSGWLDFRRLEFLKKLQPNTVKSIQFWWTDDDLARLPIKEFLQLPIVNSIKSWVAALGELTPGTLLLLIRVWNEIDVDIGSEMDWEIVEWTSMLDFVTELKELNIIETTETIVRIEMNNADKHLILKLEIWQNACAGIGKVVPNDFPASDYEKIKWRY